MSDPDSRRPTANPRLRVAEMRQTGETPFLLEPNAAARADLAAGLDIEGVKKLRFEGRLSPRGRSGWDLDGKLGATVVQLCIVTLEPVTTRIDLPVSRRYVPAHTFDMPAEGSETEIPEDDTLEPLGEVIDLESLMHEELALALPAYPRKAGVELEDAQFAADGVAPMSDADARPFAGLAALRQKMEKGDGED